MPSLSRPSADADDREARYIDAALSGVRVGCLYPPNGDPRPGPKFARNLRGIAGLDAHAGELIAAWIKLAGEGEV